MNINIDYKGEVMRVPVPGDATVWQIKKHLESTSTGSVER